jgi:hypothetical protein
MNERRVYNVKGERGYVRGSFLLLPPESRTVKTVRVSTTDGDIGCAAYRSVGISPLSAVTHSSTNHTNRGSAVDAGVVLGALRGQQGD